MGGGFADDESADVGAAGHSRVQHDRDWGASRFPPSLTRRRAVQDYSSRVSSWANSNRMTCRRWKNVSTHAHLNVGFLFFMWTLTFQFLYFHVSSHFTCVYRNRQF